MLLIFTTLPPVQSYHTPTIVHNSLAIMLNLENGPSSTPLRSTARPQYQQSPGPAYEITPGPYSGHDSDSFTSVRDPRGMRTRQLRENFFRGHTTKDMKRFLCVSNSTFPTLLVWLWNEISGCGWQIEEGILPVQQKTKYIYYLQEWTLLRIMRRAIMQTLVHKQQTPGSGQECRPQGKCNIWTSQSVVGGCWWLSLMGAIHALLVRSSLIEEG